MTLGQSARTGGNGTNMTTSYAEAVIISSAYPLSIHNLHFYVFIERYYGSLMAYLSFSSHKKNCVHSFGVRSTAKSECVESVRGEAIAIKKWKSLVRCVGWENFRANSSAYDITFRTHRHHCLSTRTHILLHIFSMFLSPVRVAHSSFASVPPVGQGGYKLARR